METSWTTISQRRGAGSAGAGETLPLAPRYDKRLRLSRLRAALAAALLRGYAHAHARDTPRRACLITTTRADAMDALALLAWCTLIFPAFMLFSLLLYEGMGREEEEHSCLHGKS